MYRAFDLRITNEELETVIENNSTERLRLWKNWGWQSKQEFDYEYKELLKDYLNNGVLNGTELIEKVFKKSSYDIFLSYSHNDEDLVYTIAGMLMDQFELKVFVDAFYWGSADDLLKEIDDLKCRNANGTYNYEKRNLTTSHVHAMLTAAIMQLMDLSEVVMFVNTEHSVPVLETTLSGKKEYTFSPWIYEEILLTNLLREKEWFIHRLTYANESYRYDEKDFEIEYELPKNNMIDLNVQILKEWTRINWRLNKCKNQKLYMVEDLELLKYEKHHPLNVLYKIVEEKRS